MAQPFYADYFKDRRLYNIVTQKNRPQVKHFTPF